LDHVVLKLPLKVMHRPLEINIKVRYQGKSQEDCN